MPQTKKEYQLFTKETQSFIYNMQTNAVQRMLDFDYVVGRKTPSVAAIINPTGNDSYQKFFYGPKEILVPVYKLMKNAMKVGFKGTDLLSSDIGLYRLGRPAGYRG
jgi:ATP-citrate lyase alpha-subunit